MKDQAPAGLRAPPAFLAVDLRAPPAFLAVDLRAPVAFLAGGLRAPVVVVGGAGGKIDGGRHVVAGSNGQYGNLTELQLGILQALGTGATTFGGFGSSKAMSLKA